MNGRSVYLDMTKLDTVCSNLLSIHFACSYPKTNYDSYSKFIKNVKDDIATTNISYKVELIKDSNLLTNMILRAQELLKKVQEKGVPFELAEEYLTAKNTFKEILKELQSQ